MACLDGTSTGLMVGSFLLTADGRAMSWLAAAGAGADLKLGKGRFF
jgi:hypothetical protein